MNSAAFPAHYLRTALSSSRTGRRYCVYAGHHPSTGGDCRYARPWQAHGGPVVAPVSTGLIGLLADRTRHRRGRSEVLRTWGIGVRALLKELRS